MKELLIDSAILCAIVAEVQDILIRHKCSVNEGATILMTLIVRQVHMTGPEHTLACDELLTQYAAAAHAIAKHFEPKFPGHAVKN